MNRTKITKLNAMVLAFLLAFSSPLSLAQGAKGKSKSKSSPSAQANGLSEEQKVIHLLDRITFGARPGDVEMVMKTGWQKYLDAQLHPERMSDQALEEKLKNIESIHLSNAELARYYPPPQVLREALKERGLDLPVAGGNQQPGQLAPGQMPTAEQIAKRREVQKALKELGYKQPQQVALELQQAKILRAVYSERQLQEVMTDFWFNHFNVFLQKGADRVLTTSYERDTIRPRVFGKFEDLLKATAESPAMLFYLDNWQSAAPNAQAIARREKFAQALQRRAMRRGQAGGVGARGLGDRPLNPRQMDRMPDQQMPGQLNNQGKIKKAPRGLNENYAREIMELHTLGVDGGYTQKDVQEVARCFTGWTIRQPRAGGDFVFNPNIHDDGEKLVLGKKIPAGGGQKDGYTVIHLLATHPSTAKFISTKLARKFVNDKPPQSLVARMAQTFQRTDGDIREVLRTMFTSPEFFASDSYRAKIKTPFEMTVSAVRAIGAETNGGPQFHRWIAQMGEALFMAQPPTGYADTAENWVNAGALLERMNFALALAGNRIPGTRVNLNSLLPDEVGSSQSPSRMVDRYVKLLLRGNLSPQSRATIDKSLNEETLARNDGSGRADAAKVVGLILGSPEFQRQ